jgi:hypothetical protein
MVDSRIKDISSLLNAFFNNETVRQGRHYAEIFGGWKQIAGERLSAHSRVVEIEKGFLIVEAEHPGWIQLLQLRQSELLDSVRRRFPELVLRGIVFRLENRVFKDVNRTIQGQTELEPPSESDREIQIVEPAGASSTEMDASAGDSIKMITDEDLKKTFDSLRKAVYESAGKKRP